MSEQGTPVLLQKGDSIAIHFNPTERLRGTLSDAVEASRIGLDAINALEDLHHHGTASRFFMSEPARAILARGGRA